MAIAQQLAGYSLGKADLLRRAMGKKKKEILDKEYIPFRDGMQANGYSEDAIATLWEILVPFSDYAFNKAHTAGYGLVSYWTAYLKANYPQEYMAALLTSVKDDKDKSAVYLNECRRMGIKVLPPDVNDSDFDFTPRGSDIRFGLSAVRNVGANVVDSIIATRTSRGRYASFMDFIDSVDVSVCNKRVVDSLIKAGAFDSLGDSRRGLVSIHEQVIDAAVELKRAEAIGQFDLFGGMGEDSDDAGLRVIPEIPLGEWEKSIVLANEREMLGLYVSDHPLHGLEQVLATASDCSIAQLHQGERSEGSTVTIGGLVTGVQRKTTKQGSVWAIVTLEDLDGAIDVMVFPQTYVGFGTLLAEDAVVLIKGRIDRPDEDAPRIVAMEVSQPDVSEVESGPVRLTVAAARCIPPVVERLKEILAVHPGTVEVHLHLMAAGRTTVLRIDDRLRVTPAPALFADLKALLGPGCLG